MSDLAQFLLARIGEDARRLDLPEAVTVLNSHGQVSARGEGWVGRGDCPVCGAYQFDGTESVTEEAWWEHAETAHQRTRVLADCDARRRIVEQVHGKAGAAVWNGEEWVYEFDRILRLLALPYADHSEYRQEWKP